MDTKALIEVRRDPPTKRCPEGDIDEICGEGTFHLERMNDSEFALIFEGVAGDRMCVFIRPKVWPKHGKPAHVKAFVFWHDESPQSVDAVVPVGERVTGSPARVK